MQNGYCDEPKTLMSLPNEHLTTMTTDHLYHLGMSTETLDFVKLFGDVKFVCCGGSAKRMEKLAHLFVAHLGVNLPYGTDLVNLCTSDRYVMYKVGPVLCVNHGIGIPSMSIMLHEVLKMLFHAGVSKDVTFFRIGTSGGIGYNGGTVVVANSAVNGLLEPYHECFVLGERVRHPVTVDVKIADALYDLSKDFDFPVVKGTTMSTDDFYEGQGRLDGALCIYNKEDKIKFLNKAHNLGVVNIEMESSAFFAITGRAGVKAAIVCVTLVNRLVTDQVGEDIGVLKNWEERPFLVVARYIKKRLAETKNGY